MKQTKQIETGAEILPCDCNPDAHVDSALAAIRAGLTRREFMGCEEGDYRWALYDAWDIAKKTLKRI